MTLSRKEVERVIEAYDTYNGIVNAAAQDLPFSAITIKKYWGRAKLETAYEKDKSINRLPDERIEKIFEAHTTYKGDTSKACKHLGVTRATIIKHWKRENLPIDPPNDNTASLEERVI
ncbi:hypothetical protein HOC80_01925 [archaeon]|jgi:DNA invertase Pin-like site-specific DNA recombinase|nr:hypothetical protein [archaeon]MBT4416840.1 hypothetical protein [archaeon]